MLKCFNVQMSTYSSRNLFYLHSKTHEVCDCRSLWVKWNSAVPLQTLIWGMSTISEVFWNQLLFSYTQIRWKAFVLPGRRTQIILEKSLNGFSTMAQWIRLYRAVLTKGIRHTTCALIQYKVKNFFQFNSIWCFNHSQINAFTVACWNMVFKKALKKWVCFVVY